MLLLDLSSVVITAIVDLLVTGKKTPDGQDWELNDNLVRHVAISQILNYKNRFRKFGEPILCADSSNYWRKQVFPNYKQNRKKHRSESNIDWNRLFDLFDQIRDELRENFPYMIIEIARVEADDIIAVLARETDEDVMIVSSDKDMVQLQLKHGKRIQQYSPAVKKLITPKSKDYSLTMHIMRGDDGDGIPNILSDDDVFLCDDKRQKPVFQKFIDSVDQAEDQLEAIENPTARKKFKRNRLLIDMDYIPQRVVEWVHQGYAQEQERPKKKRIYPYLKEKRMKLLLERIGEF
jgi:5'-3' exonuclease